MRIGITGQSGFVGTHLINQLKLDLFFELIHFEDIFFQDEVKLCTFVKQCDVIVHLAALNRDPNPKIIYETNISLIKKLLSAMELENVFPHLLFSSSTQEGRESFYGKSKLEGRILFEEWAKKNNATFTGLIIPNVYGPFSKPNYNTFVATFAQKLINREQPEIVADGDIKFIYVTNLCNLIIDIIKKTKHGTVSRIEISFDFIKKVSYILNLFTYFSDCYIRNGIIPELKGKDQINLFNTFRSYIDYSTHFPIKLNKKNDQRGFFVETIKLGIGGQVSFSTTLPGITRGNHFHTRKIERFTVIKGKARIQLRRIGSKELISHYLDGNEPAYVDMPIWYTHNITNIGKDELYTQFWINEWYDPEDGDTYYEEV